MHQKYWTAAALGLICSAALAAENPFVGHWKLDAAHSHFTGSTFTYSNGPHGMLHFSDGSTIDYDFGLDGKDYPAAYNRTTRWTSSGRNAWDTVTMADGQEIARSHRVLSDDDRKLTITFSGTQPDGQKFQEEEVYERVTGSKGLVGKWRAVKVAENAPPSFVISEPAPGKMHFDIPEQKTSVEGVADGTDLPMIGPNIPPGMTIGIKRNGNVIHYTIKMDGKTDTSGVETIAADGKSFTDVSWNAGKENEKQTALYVRQ